MHGLLVASLVIGGVSDFGNAPKDTLDPGTSVRRLLGIFENFDFSATQTFQIASPSDSSFLQISDIRGKVCTDAIVIQSKVRTKAQLRGQSAGTQVTYTERRWTRDEPSLTIELRELWPMVADDPDQVPVNTVLAFPKSEGDLNLVWGNILLRNFAERNQPSAITFLNMATDRGRRGYSLQEVKWASDDRSTTIAYQFASADYGPTKFTMSKVDDQWIPTEILIVKSSEDKVDASGRRVKSYVPFNDFTPSKRGLDRLEVVYEISYDPRPVSIKRTEIRYCKAERSIVTTTLVFHYLRSGNVTADELCHTMLPIPDGTKVMFADDNLGKLAWTIEKGQAVRKFDQLGIEAGRNAIFSSSRRRHGLIVTSLVIVALIATLLYRRHRGAIGRA